MPSRPVVLLVCLLATGLGAGVWLSRQQSASRPEEAKVTEPPQVKVTSTDSSINYLRGQVRSLQDENQALKERLAKITQGAKVEAVPGADKKMTDDDAPDFTGIAIELVKTRHLRSLPAEKKFVDRKVVEQKIRAWLATQFPADYGKRQGRALAALGAIPASVDSLDLKAALLSHQLGGWFDVNDEVLYIAQDGPEPDKKENALAMAYAEVYREFKDKIYPTMQKPWTTDSRLAVECLLGGDAALTRLLHSLENPATGGGGGVGEDPDDPSRAVPIPNFLREMELLPFSAGLDFTQTLHGIGDFAQLNAAYERPPLLGIEVLDTDAYFSEAPMSPPKVNWGDVTVNGKSPIWDDSLGALGLALYLKQHVDEEAAAKAAHAWANDRWLVYDATGGKSRDHVAWQTLWKDSKAADDFFNTLQKALSSRYRDAKTETDAKGTVRLDMPERHVLLQRTDGGTGVLYVDAADSGFAEAMRAKLMK